MRDPQLALDFLPGDRPPRARRSDPVSSHAAAALLDAAMSIEAGAPMGEDE